MARRNSVDNLLTHLKHACSPKNFAGPLGILAKCHAGWQLRLFYTCVVVSSKSDRKANIEFLTQNPSVQSAKFLELNAS